MACMSERWELAVAHDGSANTFQCKVAELPISFAQPGP